MGKSSNTDNGTRPRNRSKKRVLTDARQEQNRVAQRAFRQRQKEKTQRLEPRNVLACGKRRLRPLRPCTTTGTAEESPADPAIGEALVCKPAQEQPTQIDQCPPPIDSDWLLHPGSMEGDFSLNNELPLLSCADFLATSDYLAPELEAPQIEYLASEDLVDQTDFLSLERISQSQVVSSTPERPSLPDTQDQQNSENSQVITLPSRAWPSHPLSSQYYLPTRSENDLQAAHSNTSNNPLLPFDPQTQEEQNLHHLILLLLLPDIHTNFITPLSPSLISGGLQNALLLNIPVHNIITLLPSSLFYSPQPTSASPNTLLALSSAAHSTIPTPLQPTLAQLLFPHHAYLDLLPFPTLRARAITLAPLFNASELKRDLMRDGILFLRHGGRSWDPLCWRVAPWFGEKWRMLLA